MKLEEIIIDNTKYISITLDKNKSITMNGVISYLVEPEIFDSEVQRLKREETIDDILTILEFDGIFIAVPKLSEELLTYEPRKKRNIKNLDFYLPGAKEGDELIEFKWTSDTPMYYKRICLSFYFRYIEGKTPDKAKENAVKFFSDNRLDINSTEDWLFKSRGL